MFKQSLYITVVAFISLSVNSMPLLANTFIDNSNGTVTDTATGLIWQQQDDNVTRSRSAAISYCKSLNLAGKQEWRLPRFNELKTLAHYQDADIADDEKLFPNTKPSFYWSASRRTTNSSAVWNKVLSFGDTGSSAKSNNYVRCVAN